MENKEFLAQFSRHLIRSASKLKIEAGKVEAPELPKKEYGFEAEKRLAEEMLKMKPAARIISPAEISKISDREFAVPVPAARISEEEVSLRKELQKAREKVMRGVAPASPQAAPISIIHATELNLGKLDIFIKNPEITSIECNGPGTVLIIKKGAQLITTTTILSVEEINDIIQKISLATKTEITSMFKAMFGDMAITAFVSPIIGTRFLITKVKK